MDERKINHVVVVYMDGSRDSWPDPVTAAAEVYGVDRHGLGGAITALQYQAVAPEEGSRITRGFVVNAVTAMTGARPSLVEELLDALTLAARLAEGETAAPI